MDYHSLEQKIVQCAAAADRLIRQSYPNSPARDFIERSMLEDWGRELIQNGERELLAQELEYLFILGTRLEDMTAHVLGYEAYRLAHEETKEFPRQLNFLNEEGAFKYIKRLFAYRLLAYKRQSPNHADAKVIDALPIPTQTIAEFTSYSLTRRAEGLPAQGGILRAENPPAQVSRGIVHEQMKWNGTQKELGELFVELQRKGYINEIIEAAIQAAFTPTADLAKFLLPYKNENGIPQYKKIYTTRHVPRFNRIARKGKSN